MTTQHPLILQLDQAGNPQSWITFEDAAYYYAKDLIAWTIGGNGYTIFGGTNRVTMSQSSLKLSTIIAIKGKINNRHLSHTPHLTNRALFRRDQQICAYCGNEYFSGHLTRDHVQPTSRGGKDKWENVVTACGSCNRVKDDRTPEEAGMKLLYIPYAPTKHEHLILTNRNILYDQMSFLMAKVGKESRLHIPDFKEFILSQKQFR